MSNTPDPLDALRKALEVSPDNIPLRLHLADSLANQNRFDEAEFEFREALRRAPNHAGLKLGLAAVYFRQQKDSHAVVILEELIRQRDVDPGAYLLHAKISFREGEVARAVSMYRQAVDLDPDLADSDFAAHLGIDAGEDDEVFEGRIRAGRGEPDELPDIPVDRPTIQFDDVGGMEALKEEIRLKIIYPIEHAEVYRAYGKAIGGGMLLYGPPGCGKTHLARATAGEIDAGFISVGINDVLDMWMGNSERNLHMVFEEARSHAPCVLFFDEVDALGASRSDMRQSAGRHLINQFLAEMDGANASNDGVLILGATNAPWHLDTAFRRPGRFDRVLFVPPPDQVARAEILRVMCRDKPVSSIDFDQVAGKKTEGYSGADLKAVVDQAIEFKLTDALKTGVPQPLTTKDLTAACKRTRPSTREWFATAKNYALYSNQGGIYDDILTYLGIQ